NKRYNDEKLTIFTTNYFDEPRNVRVREDVRGKADANEGIEERLRELTTQCSIVPRNEMERQTLEQRIRERVALEQRMREKSERRIRELTILEERIGVTMRSRLYEMCETVVIEGADWRRDHHSRR